MNKKHVFTASIAVLALIFGAGVYTYRGAQVKEAAQLAARNQTYLVRDHAPTQGNATAKVHIVEFMDPACETCRSFSPLVKQMLSSHPERIRLSIRHLPLHPGSEDVVKALEASRAQDKYWQTLEALFASQARWVINHRAQPQLALAELDRVGLDMVQLRRDMDSPEVARRIAQDTSDARALKVTMTPEFFVNGRPLTSFGYEQLNELVQSALGDIS